MGDTGIFPLPRRGRWLFGLAVPALLLAGGAVWLLESPGGLRWIMAQAEQRSGGLLVAQEVAGGLFGAPRFGVLTLRGKGWQAELRGVEIAWTPSRLLLGEMELVQVRVAAADVRLAQSTDAPVALPDSLRLPLALRVLQLDIGELRQFSGQAAQPEWAARQVSARLESDDERYRWQLTQAQLGDVQLAGQGELANVAPFALRAEAHLAAPVALAQGRSEARAELHLKGDLQTVQATLEAQEGAARLTGAATLMPLAAQPLAGLQLRLEALDARRYAATAPHTRLSGTLALRPARDGLRGPLRLINADSGALDAQRLPLSQLRAEMVWQSGQFTLDDLRATLHGAGEVSGRAHWQAGQMRADLRLRQVELAALQGALPQRRVAGRLHWERRGGVQRGRLELDDGELRLATEFEQRDQHLRLPRLRLTRGAEALEGRGVLALSGKHAFSFEADLQHLDLATHGVGMDSDLNAHLAASGALLPRPAVRMDFELAHGRLGQHEVEGSGRVDYRDMRDFALSGRFQVGENRLQVAGSLGRGLDRLQLRVVADDLAQLAPGWGGHIEGDAVLTGPLEAPRLTLDFSGDELTLPGRQRLAHFALQGAVSADTLQLELALQQLVRQGGAALQQAQLVARGRPDAHQIQGSAVVGQDAAWQERIEFDARGGLTPGAEGWRRPRWQGELDRLQTSGVLPLTLRSPASLTLASDTVELGPATLALAGGSVQLGETRWDGLGWRSQGKFSGLGLRAVNLPNAQEIPEGYRALQLGGEWQLTHDDRWRVHAAVWREAGDLAVGGETPVALGLTDLRLMLDSVRDSLMLKGEARGAQLGELALLLLLDPQRDIWDVTAGTPLRGRVRANVPDIAWLGALLDESVRTEGALQVQADLGGTLGTPRLTGQVSGHGLAITLLDQGVQLEQGELQLDLRGDRIEVARLAFSAPLAETPDDPLLRKYRLDRMRGELHAHGVLDLAQGGGNLTFEADHLPLLQKPGRWVIASGQGRVGYAGKRLDIAGALRAEAGLLDEPGNTRPTLAEDVIVAVAGREPETVRTQGNQIEASLDLGDHFYLRASGLEARLTGKLDVRARPGRPLAVTGVIQAQDAVFDAYGQKLEVERGRVNFVGELDDPALDIRAMRKGLSVEAGVEVSGTARHPITRLVSTPEVPEAEKLSWIVLGRVPESGGFDTSLLLAAAGNILGGESANRVGRALGVDELSLRQQETGDPMTNQVVTVGKRLNPRAYLSYEQALAADQGITKFTYTLSPRVTLVTRTGVEDAIDLFYSFRFY